MRGHMSPSKGTKRVLKILLKLVLRFRAGVEGLRFRVRSADMSFDLP